MTNKNVVEDIDKLIARLEHHREAIELLEVIHLELTTGGRQITPATRTRLDNFVGFDDSE